MKIKKQRVSPRQKMINLMYVLLMAMLAMNVSSDVLNGFSLVDESLTRSTKNIKEQNDSIYKSFEDRYRENKEKVKEWSEKAKRIKVESDSLCHFAEELKLQIAQAADGAEADISNLKKREDLEAATYVMLTEKNGEKLCDAINEYRKFMIDIVKTDDAKKKDTKKKGAKTQDRIISLIEKSLSTKIDENPLNKNWQEYHFESMPAIAAITLLTKIQNDVRYVEGEVLHELYKKIDQGDVRVNELQAFVIPRSTSILQGDKFSAQIILAAVDSTQRPTISIDNKEMFEFQDGVYTANCDKTGDYIFSGRMSVNGAKKPIKFEQHYTVVAPPTATVSASMMNVFYAGYDNPVSISVPGIPADKISASIKGNAKMTRDRKGGYIVTPTKAGEEVKISVTTRNDEGRTKNVGEYTFRVRQLPDPTPFIEYKDKDGNTQRYRGGTKIKKQVLVDDTDGITAAIDDGLLNIGFKVISFETVFFDNMNNAKPIASKSSSFTQEQKEMIKKLKRNNRFYITKVIAEGPDKVTRQLPILEVIIE